MSLLRYFMVFNLLCLASSCTTPCRNVYYNVTKLVQKCPQQNRTNGDPSEKIWQDCLQHIKDLTSSLKTLEKEVEMLRGRRNEDKNIYSDCQSVYESGQRTGGLVKVRPDMSSPIEVYCDMSDGGWTVIQRRLTGHVSFNRNWAEYKNGFGTFSGDFWLGNERIYRLTSNADHKLRVELNLFNGSWYHATYQHFRVENESDRYRLRVSNYTGNAGDVFINSGWSNLNGNNMPFSTPDINSLCAKPFSSGWWFNRCMAGNPNGPYHPGPDCPYAGLHSPICPFWRIQDVFTKQAIKATIMKIKRN